MTTSIDPKESKQLPLHLESWPIIKSIFLYAVFHSSLRAAHRLSKRLRASR